ncbi:MAG: SPASM domain-containing protein, partial [Pseudomonadota bacterium]
EGCNRIQFNIDYLGDVHPCCMDFGSEYVLGNVTETSLIDIWRNTRHQFKQHFTGDYQRAVCFRCAKLPVPRHLQPQKKAG